MTQASTAAASGKGKTTINVTVAFPLGQGPFHDTVEPTVTAGTVRHAAMDHFGVVDDPALRFYLTHDGDEVSDSTTVGEVAGKAGAIRFILAREVING